MLVLDIRDTTVQEYQQKNSSRIVEHKQLLNDHDENCTQRWMLQLACELYFGTQE